MSNEKTIWAVLLILLVASLAIRAAVYPEMHKSSYVTQIDGNMVKATDIDKEAGLREFSPARSFGIWLSAFFTLAIFSFLYNDNPFYKVSEAIFVGVSAGYWMVVAFWTTLVPNLFGKLFPGWIQSWAIPGLEIVHKSYWWLYFIPLILGIMLLMRLSPKGGWIALWPLAFIIGTTAGLRLVAYLDADFLRQIQNTITPLTETETLTTVSMANQFVIIVGLLVCLVYFFFSIEHKGVVGKIARSGIWVLMVTFGAAFGYTVMGRITLLAARFQFLMDDWLGIIPPGAA